MKKLALYGAGDLGLGLLEVYRSCELASPTYADVSYVDDDPQAVAPDGIRLVDFDGLLREAAESDARVAVCVANPACARPLPAAFAAPGCAWPRWSIRARRCRRAPSWGRAASSAVGAPSGPIPSWAKTRFCWVPLCPTIAA